MKESKLIGITIICLLSFCLTIQAQDKTTTGDPKTSTPAETKGINIDPIIRKITYEAIKQEPKLGVKISGYPKSTDTIAGESNETYFIYYVLFNDVEYSVHANNKGRIRYIMTNDPRFHTAEGVKEGTIFREVRKLSKGEMVREDYGFYLSLASGWKAAFRTEAKGELLNSATVSWLFKAN